ncbi:thiol-disulfide oxidoreductase DCC family protein [Niallia sp. 01092]|uniref:thiol-disulfide oxidoreductase DCC family protein n=1 Tax=unclassified Niallia TaxID=2837522 RepID=UPI003FD1FF7E
MKLKKIILFDGVCNLCSASVQFIIKRDPNGIFAFSSLQSETGQKLLNEYKINNHLDSLVLIADGTYYKKSDAVLQICRQLNGGWKFFYVLKIIPSFIRDPFYHYIASNRYKWFGKKEICMLPTKEIKNRFL